MPTPPSRKMATAGKSSSVSECAATFEKISAFGPEWPAIIMYIDDCLRGTQAIMASDILEPINLGSSELVTIDGLVDIVEEIAGVKLQRSYNLKAPRGVNSRN